MSSVGKSIARIDAVGKVTGKTLFPGDINKTDQLFMKILFADRPHARIVSIDTRLAEESDGVIAVLTAKDVPVNEYGLIMPDQPVLCGPGSGIPYADRVRFIGDQVALVIAETEADAERAKRLINVVYEDLPILTDPIEAMSDDSVKLHPDTGSNIFCHYRIRKGDIKTSFDKADVVVDGVYRTPAQEHAYLQPEAGLGYIDDAGRITVEVAGQWTHEDREQIAHALGMEEDRIRVIYPAIGGAFGGREDMSVQIVLALAAWRLFERGINRPVKIIWSREESIIGHHKRHPYEIHTRWGATKDGKLLAAEVEVIADGGAYAYTSTKVLGNATLMCTGPYEIPNINVDSYAVYTNNVPGGAFRGFGGPQGAFAAETQMNRLAEKLGMSPVELRLKNSLREGSLLSVGSPLPEGVSMPQVIERCDEEMKKWDASPNLITAYGEGKVVTGRGLACAFKNVGFSFGAPEQCMATVELHGGAEIERVILHHAAAEVGQGVHTVMSQMAADAAGVELNKVELIVSDTATSDNSGSVSASRMTFMSGNSIRGAVKEALEKWQQEERPAIATFQYKPPPTTPMDPKTGKSEPNVSYGYVAQGVEVAVDTETGHIRILNVVSANDVGKAINPKQVDGQIDGAVVQASGYTLLENFVQKEGYVHTQHLSTYLIPTVLDVPDHVQNVILEYEDPLGPWGARGMGEMPFLSVAPAVIAAVNDATGVWFHEFPLTPERVLRGLGRI